MMRLRRKKKGKLFWQGFFAEEGNIYWLILNSYDQYMPVILMNSSRRTYKIMNLKGIVCEFSISLQVLMKSCVVIFFHSDKWWVVCHVFLSRWTFKSCRHCLNMGF